MSRLYDRWDFDDPEPYEDEYLGPEPSDHEPEATEYTGDRLLDGDRGDRYWDPLFAGDPDDTLPPEVPFF